MKQLTQAIFRGAPNWVKSAAVNADGSAYWLNVSKDQLSQKDGEHVIRPWVTRQTKYVGKLRGFKDWQNSAIDREVAK